MDDDILHLDEIAAILRQDPESVQGLFEEGALVGRRIGGDWYTTRRKLIDFIERGEGRPNRKPKAPPASTSPKHAARVGKPDNSWTCSQCGTRNDAERVECSQCREIRMTPLISYFRH